MALFPRGWRDDSNKVKPADRAKSRRQIRELQDQADATVENRRAGGQATGGMMLP